MSVNHTLHAIFWLALLVRMALVFIYHPLDHLGSDALRHWSNGQKLFTPDMMGGIDPKLYQFWLYGLQQLAGEARFGIGLYTGLLSAAFAWCWLQALRVILPERWALGGGLAIALMPSFTMIFGYFMNETLLLTLIAAAIWRSLVAQRSLNLRDFAIAALLWALTCYTRSVALPLAFVFLAFSLPPKRLIMAKIAIVFACFALLAVPACWHSNLRLNYCAPFGSGYLAEIYRVSQAKIIDINAPGVGHWGFSSPALHNKPLAPFSDWTPSREGTWLVSVNLDLGRSEWESELARTKAAMKPMAFWQELKENIIMGMFDPSWPDNNPHYWLGVAAIWNRFIWLPLGVAIAGLWWVTPWRARLIPTLALGYATLLLIQPNAIMEGRYRKPAEPLLVAAFVIQLHALHRRKAAL